MSALKSALLCITTAFALYLTYHIASGFYKHHFIIMDMVADVGTLLICLDLMIFLWYTRNKSNKNIQEYAQQFEQDTPRIVRISRKVGHFGILLIICSWIVPLIN